MNQTILAIDTTTEFGSIALVAGDTVIDEVLLHSSDGFGHILYQQVAILLERNERTLQQVDGFAAAAGPGSFTGVRVGLAAVKGLGTALDKPVASVSNLQAIAWFGTGPRRACVVDARRGEIYGAVYDAELNLVAPEVVARFSSWLETLPAEKLEFLSTDFGPFGAALAGTRFEGMAVTQAPRALAGAVGRIAARRLAAREPLDAAAIDANYVRRSDAELYWKDIFSGKAPCR